MQIKFRRICLYAGPGAGKSTTAHWLMWKLKSSGVVAEMSREWVKRWAYGGPAFDPQIDQAIVLGRQLEEERAAIATGAVVVTDSPIILQAAYAPTPALRAECLRIGKLLNGSTPSLNLLIQRNDRPYEQLGRWGDRASAVARDRDVRDALDDSDLPFTIVDHDDLDEVWRAVTA